MNKMNKGYENEDILSVFCIFHQKQRTEYIQVLYPFQVQLNKENKIKLLQYDNVIKTNKQN